jgi:hypothetical protein
VRDTIEDLYRAYAPVPLDPGVGYCDHCVAPEQVAALHAEPLRKIRAETIAKLLAKGVSTWGDERYFRHFLPRLLELTASGDLAVYSVETYLPSKLARCLAAGTPDERAAVDRFLNTWWADTLARYPAPVEAATVYKMITAAGWPGTPLLEAWPGAQPWHLAVFVADQAFGHPPPEIEDWLRGGVPAALLTAAGNDTDDLELLEQISWALELLAHNY